jgi:hypothetical protein
VIEFQQLVSEQGSDPVIMWSPPRSPTCRSDGPAGDPRGPPPTVSDTRGRGHLGGGPHLLPLVIVGALVIVIRALPRHEW